MEWSSPAASMPKTSSGWQSMNSATALSSSCTTKGLAQVGN